jgi:hypothetical protein
MADESTVAGCRKSHLRGVSQFSPPHNIFLHGPELANTRMNFVSAIYPSGLSKPAILKLSDQNTDEVGTRLAWWRYCAVPARESNQRLKAKFYEKTRLSFFAWLARRLVI